MKGKSSLYHSQFTIHHPHRRGIMPFAGIDIGSTMTKAVVVDEKEQVLASHIGPTGVEHRHLALTVMDDTLGKAGVDFDHLDYIVATGYAASMCRLPTSKSRKSPATPAASGRCFPPRASSSTSADRIPKALNWTAKAR